MKHLLSLFLIILAAVPSTAQQWDNYRSLLVDPDVRIDETNLPIVFFDTQNQVIQRGDYILAHMKIIHNGDGQKNYGDTIAHPGQHVDHEGWIGLKYRGNSSFDNSDRKPFAIQTLEGPLLSRDGGKKLKTKLLGMGKDNKWAMLAPWSDRSMIRDVLTFQLAQPWLDFAPHTRHCEVILDGTYYGIYVLLERNSKGKHRLNLDDPGSADGDLTGDFLVEIDRADQLHFVSPYRPWYNATGQENRNREIVYQYKFPEEDDFPELPAGTREAMNRQILNMEDAFRLPNYTDPDEGYPSQIDIDSWIDFQLSQEFAFNIDGYRLSTPLYKYSRTRAQNEGLDPRWKMCLWDFNLGYGNANYNDGTTTNLWLYDFNARNPGDGYQIPFYWYKLMADPEYVQRLEDRWTEYRRSNYSDNRVIATIDSLTNLITSGGAFDRNQQAWQLIGRWGVWPCPYNPQTYEDEILNLKNWIRARTAWLDQTLHLPVQKRTSRPIALRHGDWKDDLVAEKNNAASITHELYSGYTLYSEELYANGGLPADGRITSGYYGVDYQLAPYDENNCVFLDNHDEQVMAYFDEPVSTSELFILATRTGSANPPSFAIKVFYTDGTCSSDWERRELNEWIQANPDGTAAITGLGRLSTAFNREPAGFKCTLWDVLFPTDPSKEIEGVRLRVRDYSKIAVFGFSAATGFQDTGIESIPSDRHRGDVRESSIGIFSPDGRKMNDLRPGLNIIRHKDGTTKKIIGR